MGDVCKSECEGVECECVSVCVSCMYVVRIVFVHVCMSGVCMSM